MANMNKLRGRIIEAGLSIDDIAESLQINRSTMYRKLADNGLSFTVREVAKIVNELSLSPDDAFAIFFNHNVA